MRSIIATSAAAAAYGATPGAPPLSCDLRGEPLGQRPQRLVAYVAESLVAFLGREVAGAQDRAVRVPVAEEAVDELAGAIEPVVAASTRARAARRPARSLADLFGEREHRLFHVAEVLVEGRRRRPDLARDVDDAQVAHAVLSSRPVASAAGAGTQRPASRVPARQRVARWPTAATTSRVPDPRQTAPERGRAAPGPGQR